MQTPTPQLTKQPRKTRRGWLGYKVKQIHLREDIPCGLEFCAVHSNQTVAFRHVDVDVEGNMDAEGVGEGEGERGMDRGVIYFVESQTLLEQLDVVYNCGQICNVVFLQSDVEKLRRRSLNRYNAFKNFLEVQAVGQQDQQPQTHQNPRNFWLFADTYHKHTAQTLKQKLQLLQSPAHSQKQWLTTQICAEWYQNHLQQLHLNYKVIILTINDQYIKQGMTGQGVKIVSLISFLRQRNSNLLDFVGFGQGDVVGEMGEMGEDGKWDEHLEVGDARRRIREGKLFQGKYMGEKSYFKINKTVFKIKLENNRAMFGDVVAIEINPYENWQKIGAKAIITQQQDRQDGLKLQQADNQEITQSQTTKNLLKLLESNLNLLPNGKIRSILKKTTKDYCGSANTQKIIKSSEHGWKMLQFKPADDRFPLFYIRTYDIDSIRGKRIQVAYDSWPKNSVYPLCHFLRVIGKIGDSRAEGDVILLEHNVEIKEFSRKAYECLPKEGSDFKISKQEEAYRLDLRNLDVVSIDPPGCKDIDDALHCIRLPNGNLQIGVHIADVSYYVRPDSALDLQARNRCTTVYLVDRRTDMLPKLLTQNLCSLRANVDRLAFSTIWQMDESANIISTKYCKTIIRSRNAFTYMQAQQLMQSSEQTPIANSIRNLNKIAKKLKQKRLNDGALTLASTQVKVTLEEETHSATDVQLYQMVQANYLIEEFMLLANIAVAEKIYSRFPSISILRRHTPPKVRELEALRQILSLYKFELNYETSRALADSLDKIQKQNDPFFNKLIRILTTRCMNEATYFCSADFDPQQFYHYGLAAPFYTHFTSPIRRYADVLVHRLLAAAIDLEPLPHFMINKIKMGKICDKMNMRNRMARYASRASSDYHTYQFFKQKQGQKQSGVITSISETHITIMLVKYGLQCKYQLNPTDSQKTTQQNKSLGVFNTCSINNKTYKLFQYIEVSMKVQMQDFHKKITIDF